MNDMYPRQSLMDDRIDEITSLIHCKKMLDKDDAWNPAVKYNYSSYLRDGICASPKDLRNIEEIKKEFCNDSERKKHPAYNRAIGEGICHR